jgi:pimeloyl-ACP methyl ester carboxylesterase
LTARLSVAGRSVDVQWWGSRDSAREVIVMLHEGLGSVGRWKDWPAALHEATNLPVMAYSRLGHGRSDPPAAPRTIAFMHEEAQQVLPGLLDAAAIETAIFFGHSDGASIALIFAATFPQRTRALILEAPHVFVEDISIASIEEIDTRWRESNLRERLARHHDHVDVAFHGWRDVWLDPAFREWNLEEFLPYVTCPLLLIQGTGDQYGTLRQVDAIADQVAGPVDVLVLDDCGHSPHRDRPEDVLAAARRFVAGL